MKIVLGKTSRNWTSYGGPLPHGLKATSSKDEVVALLGDPAIIDDFFGSARWSLDKYDLGILFTDDWKAIKQLGLSLPRAI